MLPSRCKLFGFVAAALATATLVSAADAGWVTIKNDTNKAIVVQEVTVLNGRVVRGKPTRLLAGESFREFQNTAGEKNYEVYESTSPNAPVWTGKLNCKADSQSFSVTTTLGKVGVISVPVQKKP